MFADYFQGVADARNNLPQKPNPSPEYIKGYKRQRRRNPITVYAVTANAVRKVRAKRSEIEEVSARIYDEMVK